MSQTPNLVSHPGALTMIFESSFLFSGSVEWLVNFVPDFNVLGGLFLFKISKRSSHKVRVAFETGMLNFFHLSLLGYKYGSSCTVLSFHEVH